MPLSSQVARCGGHGATKQILACFAYCFAPGAVGPLQAAGSKPEVFLKPHAVTDECKALVKTLKGITPAAVDALLAPPQEQEQEQEQEA